MALKLKTAVVDLYKRITGVPKTELKTQGEMIREDWGKGPGRDYTAKSAILNAVNIRDNKFRPKGGIAPHLAQDAVAPIIGSMDLGRVATEVVNRVTRGGATYADLDRITNTTRVNNSLESKYGLRYDDEKSFPINADDEPGLGDFVDLIPVRIGEYQFRGAIGGLTDNSSPSWTGTSYAGRPDQVYSYGGVERTISFDLKVYVASHTQIKNMYQRVNKLYELTRPSPDDLFQPTRMSAPITRLTIGDYLREQVILTGLTVAPIEELAWEINDPDKDYPSNTLDVRYSAQIPNITGTKQRYIVPRGLNMSLNFTVIHDEVPTTAAKAFRSKTDSSTSTGY